MSAEPPPAKPAQADRNRAPGDLQQRLEPWLKLFTSIIGAVFLAVVASLGLVLIWRILTTDTSLTTHVIGSASSAAIDSATLIQSNQRLLQMVQWTIGLVITIGGLLIGFGWFQNRSRYDDDRQRLLEWKEELKEGSRLAREDATAARNDLATQAERIETLTTRYEERFDTLTRSYTEHETIIRRQLSISQPVENRSLAAIHRAQNILDSQPESSPETESMAVNLIIDALVEWLVDLETFRPDNPISVEPFIQSAGILHQLVQTGTTTSTISAATLQSLTTTLRKLLPQHTYPQLTETYQQWNTALATLIAAATPDDPI
ncbi:MAG: hypothetical protein ACRDHN_04760 [Thermomicrobiales bacterium]